MFVKKMHRLISVWSLVESTILVIVVNIVTALFLIAGMNAKKMKKMSVLKSVLNGRMISVSNIVPQTWMEIVYWINVFSKKKIFV